MYLANQAVLTTSLWNENDVSAEDGTDNPRGGRIIYSGAGASVHKPRLSILAIAIITFVLFLQMLGLGLLSWFIYRGLSEIRSLDVMTFSRLMAGMDEDKIVVDH